MSVPHWLELCAALGALGRRARRAGSHLDPTHDALLVALGRSHEASYPLAVVLEELPPERASRAACGQLELIARFPSAAGAAAAVNCLELVGGGPYYEAIFKRVIAAIGAPARLALETAISRGSPQRAVLEKCLSRFVKVGKKKGSTSRK